MFLRNLTCIVAMATLLSCSGDSSGDGEAPCPPNETRSAISGLCVSVVGAPDGGNETSDTAAQPDAAVEDTATADMQVVPDQGPQPDMQPPQPDMQPPDMSDPPDMDPPGVMIRFVAIGDQGTGSETQRNVGAAIGTVCASLGGCDFGLLLGDNFYNSGVDSVDDSLWVTNFEVPYGNLGFPFYASLGNHDLGGDGLGIDLDQNKANYQIDYGAMNPQWIMPSRYYDFTIGPAHFVALDTTKIFFGDDSNQRQDVPGMIANAGNNWRIAFGHHPYYSNGPHGNAGTYEGIPANINPIPYVSGEEVQSFMEDHICGQVDFYICGHDHSRQDLVPDCQGTQFIVSGAGAKTTELEGNNPAHFESDVEGFLLAEVTDTTFLIRFYDEAGVMNHERLVTR